MAGRAAIYHFTNGSEKRPAVNKKELDRLADFARQKGYTDIEIFCDTSLRKEDQHEFRRLMVQHHHCEGLLPSQQKYHEMFRNPEMVLRQGHRSSYDAGR